MFQDFHSEASYVINIQQKLPALPSIELVAGIDRFCLREQRIGNCGLLGTYGANKADLGRIPT